MNFYQPEIGRRKLDNWVAGRGGNTALVVGVTSQEEETLETPAGSPAVLDDPVV